MKTLVPIEPWKKVTISKGKFVGKKVEVRHVIAVDKWNFCIAQEQKGRIQVIGHSFYGSLRRLLEDLPNEIKGVKIELLIHEIINELEIRTGIKFPDIEFESLQKTILLIDETFKTNFHYEEYPPKIFSRIFGEEEDSLV